MGPFRIFATVKHDADAPNALVTSILSVCSHDAFVLKDLRSTYSYESPYFIPCLGRDFAYLNDPFDISTLVGASIRVDRACYRCVTSIQHIDTIVDLMILNGGF